MTATSMISAESATILVDEEDAIYGFTSLNLSMIIELAGARCPNPSIFAQIIQLGAN